MPQGTPIQTLNREDNERNKEGTNPGEGVNYLVGPENGGFQEEGSS